MLDMEAMKEMIRREIQSISTLEERVAFKDLMEGVFISLYETNLSMYRKLEERIMNDLAYDAGRYLIRTGIVERACYDWSHHQMSAMQEEDTKPRILSAGEIREEISRSGRYRAGSVFLRCDSIEVSGLAASGMEEDAVIKAGREYPVKVHVQRSRRYLDQIGSLYRLFIKNGIPWVTVNAPYLFKMLDLYISSLPEEIADEEAVILAGVELGAYNKLAYHDMVPIWNVGYRKVESVGFPVPCADRRGYEHVVSLDDGAEHGYLVADEEAQEVRRVGEKLYIMGRDGRAKRWDICTIRGGRERRTDRYSFPVMENLRRDTFCERFQKNSGRPVRTRGELERYIRGFGLEDQIGYAGCSIEEETGEAETYSMNFFIEDEIRDKERRKRLVLTFRQVGAEKWLLRDLAGFLASSVQEFFPEYHCMGRLL